MNSLRLSLRPATPEDAPWLEQLRRSMYQELFIATFGAWDEARHLRQFAACLARGEIWLVELEGERDALPDGVCARSVRCREAHGGGVRCRLPARTRA